VPFLIYIGETPVATAGLTMAERVVRLWGAATVPEFRGRGAYKILVRARSHEGRARGASLGIVNARTGTSGPILRRIGFREVASIREYTGTV
jgi:predicted GNAT family acetyltransferase